MHIVVNKKYENILKKYSEIWNEIRKTYWKRF